MEGKRSGRRMENGVKGREDRRKEVQDRQATGR